MQFIDTHSHLYSDKFNKDRPDVINNAIAVGVETILLPNISSKYTNKMLALCTKFPKNCYPMMGLHPCYVTEDNYEKEITHVKEEIKKGTRLNQIMRHTLGLFHGQTGSNFWKRYLSENLCVRDADVKKIDHIMDKVKLAPETRLAGQID